MKKCVRVYWLSQIRTKFLYWKFRTKLMSIRERALRIAFYAMRLHTNYKRHIHKQLIRITFLLIRLRSAEVIQRVYRWHYPRLLFWATKTIKRNILRWYSYALIRHRRIRDFHRKNKVSFVFFNFEFFQFYNMLVWHSNFKLR
jgi:hypothetical protein